VRKTLSTRRLRIPVRYVNDTWECAWGGAIPIKNDTEAELVVQRSAISDKAFLETMERKGRHKVLDEGTTLLVCLTIKSNSQVPGVLRPLLKTFDHFRGAIAMTYLDHWNSGSIEFVEVTLAGPDEKQAIDTNRGGLWLRNGAEAAASRAEETGQKGGRASWHTTSRLTAGAIGFLTLSQFPERPDRYGELTQTMMTCYSCNK
jgi:hypothetical protein